MHVELGCGTVDRCTCHSLVPMPQSAGIQHLLGKEGLWLLPVLLPERTHSGHVNGPLIATAH